MKLPNKSKSDAPVSGGVVPFAAFNVPINTDDSQKSANGPSGGGAASASYLSQWRSSLPPPLTDLVCGTGKGGKWMKTGGPHGPEGMDWRAMIKQQLLRKRKRRSWTDGKLSINVQKLGQEEKLTRRRCSASLVGCLVAGWLANGPEEMNCINEKHILCLGMVVSSRASHLQQLRLCLVVRHYYSLLSWSTSS